MDLAQIIEALSDPAAYPDPVERGGGPPDPHLGRSSWPAPIVYKVKKPVELGFLDFGTLAQAPALLRGGGAPQPPPGARTVYLGVVPVTCATHGRAGGGRRRGRRVGGEDAAPARRSHPPEPAPARGGRSRGGGGPGAQDRRLPRPRRGRPADRRASAASRWWPATPARTSSSPWPRSGTTVSRAVFARLRALTEEALARHRPLIESRAERGVPRDTHGDLRLGHVYYFPDREPPGDLVILDCIEFDERFRFADPVADMAFLVMGLNLQGHRDLARAFAEAYFLASGDGEGRALLPFYTSYRAAVRGKVEGLKLARPEIPEADRAAALTKARGSWLLALGELEAPSRRPCLVLVGGLPGTGKSTLARALAERAGFRVIRSDLVRKELAGVRRHGAGPVGLRGGHLRGGVDRTHLRGMPAPGRGAAVRGGAGPGGRQLPRGGLAPGLSRSGRPAGVCRAASSSARPSRTSCGSAWRAAGTMPPTRTGPSI